MNRINIQKDEKLGVINDQSKDESYWKDLPEEPITNMLLEDFNVRHTTQYSSKFKVPFNC